VIFSKFSEKAESWPKNKVHSLFFTLKVFPFGDILETEQQGRR
jgi:hypothetical protein